ncbi:hypothetical protein [Terrihabitans rhizophilus]|uniref:Uncharacterized protein n=1 Tax=Terrihabitans rhizophilus TaxID=3092662 RepID=A0ABU4RNE3_9HYPH|nr:hypothetical protein [Terrihabitans sp. PJ23]MDX6806347.1 hypothetical protein [Terrihabitans sp. PJ23]
MSNVVPLFSESKLYLQVGRLRASDGTSGDRYGVICVEADGRWHWWSEFFLTEATAHIEMRRLATEADMFFRPDVLAIGEWDGQPPRSAA